MMATVQFLPLLEREDPSGSLDVPRRCSPSPFPMFDGNVQSYDANSLQNKKRLIANRPRHPDVTKRSTAKHALRDYVFPLVAKRATAQILLADDPIWLFTLSQTLPNIDAASIGRIFTTCSSTSISDVDDLIDVKDEMLRSCCIERKGKNFNLGMGRERRSTDYCHSTEGDSPCVHALL